jgi:gliding motility-associated-like protein
MRKSLEVIVPEDIYVPNTFTPNDDSMNDYFSVYYKNINSATISIFDRWGEKIYESNDKDFKWDGKYKGRKIQHDTYIYNIDAIGYYGTPINKMGRLTVLY